MGPRTLGGTPPAALELFYLSKTTVTKECKTIHTYCNVTSRLLCVSVSLAKTGKDSPYSTAKRRVPELIFVIGIQPAGDVSHKPGGRLPLLSARPAVTLATIKRAATNVAAW